MQLNFFHYNSQLRLIESFKLRTASLTRDCRICNLQKVLFSCPMIFFILFFFYGLRRELIANFYIWDAKKKKQNIAIKISVQYRSFRFKQFSLFMARLIFTQGAGMHDCGHKARVSPPKIKRQLSPWPTTARNVSLAATSDTRSFIRRWSPRKVGGTT